MFPCIPTPALFLLAALAGSAQDESPNPTSLTAGFDGERAFLRSEDGDFLLELGGRLHLDSRAYSSEPAVGAADERATPPDSFVLRRARFEAAGTLYKDESNPEKDLYFEFKVQADFADVESALLRDGYVNIHLRDQFQVMAGQFKAPFSQEEIQSSKYIPFVERSMLNNLAPSRSPGVMVFGALKDSLIQYELSLQNDRGELGLNSTTGPDLFGRARFKPVPRGPFEKLFLGGAFGAGDREDETLLIGRTSSRSVVFFDRVPLNGELVRRNLETAWYYRNIGIESEYVDASAERLGLGEGGSDLPKLEARGVLVSALYVLTGEDKSEKGIAPKRPVQDGGPGAWEVGFRYERFEVDEGTVEGNLAQTYTFGVNWWLNKFLRYQANLIFEDFRRPPSGFADASIVAFLTRLGVHF